MNKQEFLRQLETLLQNIPTSEREEAMEYYRNYFEDAGPEKEEDIIQELGSPEKVAESIRKDIFGEQMNSYQSAKGEGTSSAERLPYSTYESSKEARKNKTQRNILLVLLLIFTFPIWISVLAVIFGLSLGLVGTLFGIIVAGVAMVFSGFLAGFVLIGAGIAKIFVGFPAVGIMVFGAGLIALALSVLGVLVMAWIFGGILPWIGRGIGALFRKIFGRKMKGAA